MNRHSALRLLLGIATSLTMIFVLPIERFHSSPEEPTRLSAALIDLLEEAADCISKGDLAGVAFMSAWYALVQIAALLPALLSAVIGTLAASRASPRRTSARQARIGALLLGGLGIAGLAATVLIIAMRAASFGFGGGTIANQLPGFWAVLGIELLCAGAFVWAGLRPKD